MTKIIMFAIFLCLKTKLWQENLKLWEIKLGESIETSRFAFIIGHFCGRKTQEVAGNLLEDTGYSQLKLTSQKLIKHYAMKAYGGADV
jgi:hypothetical protein